MGFWPGVWDDSTSKGIASNGISVKRGGPLLLILDGAMLALTLDAEATFFEAIEEDNLDAASA